MLYLARSLSQLHFGSLMAVYSDANRENGRGSWPEEPEMRQIQLAEADFYRYLSQVFFKTPGAVYAVWEENGGQSGSVDRRTDFRFDDCGMSAFAKDRNAGVNLGMCRNFLGGWSD